MVVIVVIVTFAVVVVDHNIWLLALVFKSFSVVAVMLLIGTPFGCRLCYFHDFDCR